MNALDTGSQSIGARLIRGASWSFIGTLLSQLLLMALTVVISHLLGKNEFGSYILLQTTLTTLGIFTGLGMGTLATRYGAALKSKDQIRLGKIITIGMIYVAAFGMFVSFAIGFFADFVADHILHNKNIGSLLLMASGSVLFTTLDNYQKSVMIGFEQLKQVAICSILGALATVAGIFSFSIFFGIEGAAIALTGVAMMQYAISTSALKKILVRQGMPLYQPGWKSEQRLVVSFGLPALLANIIVPAAMWSVQAILARSDNGYVELALYGIAMQWFNALLFVPSVANKILMPMLTELVESKNINSAKDVVKTALKVNFIFTTLFVAIFCALSKLILTAYGNSYPRGALVLNVVATASVLASMMNVSGNLVSAHSKMWLGSLMNLGWSVIFVGGAFLLVQRGFGALGVAIALLVAYLAHFLWSSVWMKSVISYSSR